MVPPRPDVIAHGKVLRVVCEPHFGTLLSLREARPSVLARPDGAALTRVGWFIAISHLRLNANETRMPRLETFGQSTSVSILLWVLNRQSLGKASPTCTPPPICTLAPFPKPRWS